MGDGSMSRENVIFIGFMGAGKTSVGRAYAQAAGIPLVDTDQMIEEEAGMTISDIYRLKGEEFIRKTETAPLSARARRLSEGDGAQPLRTVQASAPPFFKTPDEDSHKTDTARNAPDMLPVSAGIFRKLPRNILAGIRPYVRREP